MEYCINFPGDVNVIGDIVTDEIEIRIADEMCNVTGVSGNEIVHANNGMTFSKKAVTEMRADESGSAGDKYAHDHSERVGSDQKLV